MRADWLLLTPPAGGSSQCRNNLQDCFAGLNLIQAGLIGEASGSLRGGNDRSILGSVA